jgi:hypothetical protein
MAFTRPRAAQINFDLTNISDPLIRINSAESGDNTNDLGIVFERGNHTNAAIVWDESADAFRMISTTHDASTTTTDINISAHHSLHVGGLGLTGDIDMGGNDITNTDLLRINQTGSGLRMTNVGAFDNDGSDNFRVFATNDLKIAANGENGTAITIDATNQDVTITNDLRVSAGQFYYGGTAVTSTAAELNYLDGVTGITLGSANELLVVGTDGSSIASDSTLAVDTANNRLGINQTSPEVTLHMTGEDAQTAQIRMEQYNNSGDAPDIRTRRYRGTVASPLAVNSGDYLFRSNHEYWNGTSLIVGGSFAFDNTNNAARTQFSVAVDTDGTGADPAGTNGQFKIDGNDSGAITFNNAYKFPTADGSANQVLATNGSGTLSFVDAGGGGGDVVEDTTPQLGGDLASNGNDVLFADNDKAIFGAGSDLQIYHDGSHSYVTDEGTGNLRLRGSNFVQVLDASGNDMIQAEAGGAVDIYHNGSTKLATASFGAQVTGSLAVDTITNASSSTNVTIDTNFDIILDGANVGIGTTSPLTLSGNAAPGLTVSSNGPYILLQDANNANTVRYMSNNTGVLQFGIVDDDGATSKTEQMRIDSDGNVGIGTSSPTFLTGSGLEVSRSGTATVRVERTGATASAGELFAGSNKVVLGTATDTQLQFRTNNTERVRINTSGDVDFTGSVNIGSTIGTRTASLSIESTGSSSPWVAKSSLYATVASILPWASCHNYIGTGIYYDDGTWVHASDNTTNSLFALHGTGANWYSSNNSTGSWNVASNVPLWNASGQWTGDINTTYDINTGVITGTATAARYADLAEKYTTDADYEPGTVLIFGGEEEVTLCTKKYDRRIAGIVSVDPAYLMNNDLQNASTVALVGRVPCKVVGFIRKGDLMVSSDTDGHAEAWRDESSPPYGTVIGKSLENKDSRGTGVVEVVVGAR